GHAPGLAFPDRVLQLAETVRHKGSAAGHAKNFEIVGSNRASASGKIRGEDAHHDAVHKPLHQILGESGRSARANNEEAHWATLELLDGRGGLHVLHGGMRKVV